MAIAYDAVASKGSGAGAFTFNHTIGGGTNRILILLTGGHGSAAANMVPTGVKYNGVAMTALGAAPAWNKTGNYYTTEAFYMLEANLPAAGTYAITGTTGANEYSDQLISISLSGCKQQAMTYVSATSVVAATTISTTGLTYRATDWLVDSGWFWPPSASTYTPGANQTFRKEQAGDRWHECSTRDSGAAGTSWTENQNWNSAGLLTLDLEQYTAPVTGTGAALLMYLARNQ